MLNLAVVTIVVLVLMLAGVEEINYGDGDSGGDSGEDRGGDSKGAVLVVVEV